jgi:murein DD-endopeptidase MepM/ murein hydrolase activator NlpD
MTNRRNIPHPVSLRQKILNLVIRLLTWCGIAVVYYILFYSFLDTPFESQLKEDTQVLEQQYEKLKSRYDTINRIIANLESRDRNVYISLFEAEPLSEVMTQRDESLKDSLLKVSNIRLNDFFTLKLSDFETHFNDLEKKLMLLSDSILHSDVVNYIPKIQPITNKNYTLLSTSYGMRIQPFYKSITMHRGVDFMASEGTRVYATADGTVSAVNSRKGASSGISVTITHGKSGYKTFYGHLSRASVKRGQRVRQGDIIGLTGNSGLSFVPHLHYEVLFNDVQVDPLYYFFKEVPPWDMQRLRSIASTGMQSLD